MSNEAPEAGYAHLSHLVATLEPLSPMHDLALWMLSGNEQATRDIARSMVRRARATDFVACLVCGEEAFEVQLCRDDLEEYYTWKRLDGDMTSTNRVAEFVAIVEEVTR